MWKVLLISGLFSITSFAKDRQGLVNEMGGDEGQDAEECATAPGNPKSLEECRKAKKDSAESFDSCLSENSVKNYEKSAFRAVRFVEEQAGSASVFEGRNARVVFQALNQSGLIKDPPAAPLSASNDRGLKMQANGFTDLLKCPAWAKKLKDSKNIPLGAVLVYSSVDKKDYGDIRIKTPKGCLSSAPALTAKEQEDAGKGPESSDYAQMILAAKAKEHVKKAYCLDNPGYTLTGIYVKNVN